MIGRDEAAARGFTVLIDNHSGYYRRLKPLISSVSAALGGRHIEVAIVLKRDKFSLQERLRRSKFRVGCRTGRYCLMDVEVFMLLISRWFLCLVQHDCDV